MAGITAPAGVRTAISIVTEDLARVSSVDILRGLVMVIMALDHVRDYMHVEARLFIPTDLDQTSPLLFLTRWITHYCAPIFVLLAGLGAGLSALSGRSRIDQARFLITRGLWLIFLELTIILFAWNMTLDFYQTAVLGIIWAIGASMIVLAGLLWLPRMALIALSLAIIFGHNLLDGITPDGFEAATGLPSGFWKILHAQAVVTVGGWSPFALYPLIPLIGVIGLGYGLSGLYGVPEILRRRVLLSLGFLFTAGFFVVRGLNGYGDPSPWTGQESSIFTVLSFLNTTKYPSSLAYLLMTLGPAFLFLAWTEQSRGPVARVLATIGRVPLFYYVLHLFLIHGIAILLGLAQGFSLAQMQPWFFMLPKEFGVSLWAVFGLWLLVVALLTPLCAWYAGVKRRSQSVLFSYL